MKKGYEILGVVFLSMALLSCGGGGGDGTPAVSGNPSGNPPVTPPASNDPPAISNLSYAPTAGNRNGASTPVTCTVNYTDAGENVTTMTMTGFDSAGGQVYNDTVNVSGAGPGKLSAIFNFPSTDVGNFTFQVYVTDANGNSSTPPLTGTFSVVDAWVAKASMPVARDSGTAGAVSLGGQTKVYMIGGMLKQDPLTLTNRVDQYDVATGTWTQKADMPTARTDHNSAVVGTEIYVFGGYDAVRQPLSTLEVYDTVNDKWTTKASMPVPRFDFGVAVVGGKIYLIGGLLWEGEATNRVDVYNPATNTWDTTLPPMPTPRAYLAVTAIDRNIYAIGGSKPRDGGFYSEVEVYNVDTNTWTTKTPLPTPRDEMSLGVVNSGGKDKICLFGGWDIPGALIPSNKVEIYDVASDTWAQKAALPEPWAPDYNTVVVDDGTGQKVYVFGGIDFNGQITSSVRVYDPAADIQ